MVALRQQACQLAESRRRIPLRKSTRQIKNPTFPLIADDCFDILAPDGRAIADVEQQFIELLLQRAQVVTGPVEKQFPSARFEIFSRLAQSWGDEFEQTFSADFAGSIPIQAQVKRRARLLKALVESRAAIHLHGGKQQKTPLRQPAIQQINQALPFAASSLGQIEIAALAIGQQSVDAVLLIAIAIEQIYERS